MAGKKILVVDDDIDIRLGLGARLRASGYEVVFAEDCASALVAAKEAEPDLILLDLGLPGDDGFVVLARLAAEFGADRPPVVVLSARDSGENERLALEAGARAFLEKPAENAEMLAAIERYTA